MEEDPILMGLVSADFISRSYYLGHFKTRFGALVVCEIIFFCFGLWAVSHLQTKKWTSSRQPLLWAGVQFC